MTTTSLDELLKTAETGELARPVAKALVKVAMAAEASARKRAAWRRFRSVDASHDDWPKQVEDADQAMIESLADLATALKEV